eukprot:TRINITY_DN24676_c0_g1_i1.p1 TRINITY_DN24676_c0_g1~~TRINITY_DN24676_c0_g1_i1.p1  ORF type:complete len:182 (+),score=75.15 TRINITY_DN24676_c0_g1_i1:86-631(+)
MALTVQEGPGALSAQTAGSDHAAAQHPLVTPPRPKRQQQQQVAVTEQAVVASELGDGEMSVQESGSQRHDDVFGVVWQELSHARGLSDEIGAEYRRLEERAQTLERDATQTGRLWREVAIGYELSALRAGAFADELRSELTELAGGLDEIRAQCAETMQRARAVREEKLPAAEPSKELDFA